MLSSVDINYQHTQCYFQQKATIKTHNAIFSRRHTVTINTHNAIFSIMYGNNQYKQSYLLQTETINKHKIQQTVTIKTHNAIFSIGITISTNNAIFSRQKLSIYTMLSSVEFNKYTQCYLLQKAASKTHNDVFSRQYTKYYCQWTKQKVTISVHAMLSSICKATFDTHSDTLSRQQA